MYLVTLLVLPVGGLERTTSSTIGTAAAAIRDAEALAPGIARSSSAIVEL